MRYSKHLPKRAGYHSALDKRWSSVHYRNVIERWGRTAVRPCCEVRISEGNLLEHLQREQFALGAPEILLVTREIGHIFVAHGEMIAVRPHTAIVVGVEDGANVHQRDV